MNKHIFDMSKIKHMRKNQGFSEINLMTVTNKGINRMPCAYKK